MTTNASIWWVLLAIEYEELSIYTFFVKGSSYVSQKTLDKWLNLTQHFAIMLLPNKIVLDFESSGTWRKTLIYFW
jgi:hypothetical protein